MRVFLHFRQNSPNDQEGKDDKDSVVANSDNRSNDIVPIVEAKPNCKQKSEDDIADGPAFTAKSPVSSVSNSNSKPEASGGIDFSEVAKKVNYQRNSSQQNSECNHVPSRGKPDRLKTTGLDTADCSQFGIKTSSFPSSRKRRVSDSSERQSCNSLSTSQKSNSAISRLDKKPRACEKTGGGEGKFDQSQFTNCSSLAMVSGNNPRRVNSSADGNDGSIDRPWRYFGVRQAEDDVRQDPEDPVEDDDVVPTENNPESARGDAAFSSSTLNHPASRINPNASALAAMPPIRERSVEHEDGVITSESSADFVKFANELKKRGLEIREQDGDGNCLFRAISLQIYGDASMHGDVRKQCMDFMDRDQEHFSQFVTGEPFQDYIKRKRQDGVHGNNPEIQAISELFNRPIEVFTPETGAKPLNIFHAEYKTDDAPIRLSYHDGNHYNAVVDPVVPTAGLGLGLPGLQPGLADKMQMAKAVAESDAAADNLELQRAMKESEEDEIQRKMKESEDDELQRAIKLSRMSADSIYNDGAPTFSDMDATYEQLEQAALAESLRLIGNEEKKQASRAITEQETRDDNLPADSQTPRASCGDENPFGSAAAGSASMPTETSVSSHASTLPLRPVEEYSNTVQELVMNGFELRDVLKAYDLVGDNFDDILSLLLAKSSRRR